MPTSIAEYWNPVTKQYESAQGEGGAIKVSIDGGMGGGDASAAKQDEQTALLQTIADAADVPLSDVVAATNALGNGATIAQIVSALGSDATTQENILAKLTAINSTLSTNSPALVGGKVPTTLAGETVTVAGTVTATTNGLTDAQLRASPVAVAVPAGVSVTNTITVDTELAATGNLATEAKQGGGLPAALVGGRLDVNVGASTTLPVSAVALPLPSGAATSALQPSFVAAEPAPTLSAPPVRIVPDFIGGKELHVQTDVGIANGANKLLLGFTNGTGQTVYVTKINASNMQTATIAGVFTFLYVRRGTTAITGGTTLTTVTSPAIVPGMKDPTFSIPAGFTWNTNGTLGGTITQNESTRWTTDEVSPNGSGLAEMILAQRQDTWDFETSPIAVPNGASLAVVCDASATNGNTLIDFNIRFAQ